MCRYINLLYLHNLQYMYVCINYRLFAFVVAVLGTFFLTVQYGFIIGVQLSGKAKSIIAASHHVDADADPPFPSMRIRTRTLLRIKIIRICDHWHQTLNGSILSLYASIVGVRGSPL
jgi:hypothetical protein